MQARKSTSTQSALALVSWDFLRSAPVLYQQPPQRRSIEAAPTPTSAQRPPEPMQRQPGNDSRPISEIGYAPKEEVSGSGKQIETQQAMSRSSAWAWSLFLTPQQVASISAAAKVHRSSSWLHPGVDTDHATVEYPDFRLTYRAVETVPPRLRGGRPPQCLPQC